MAAPRLPGTRAIEVSARVLAERLTDNLSQHASTPAALCRLKASKEFQSWEAAKECGRKRKAWRRRALTAVLFSALLLGAFSGALMPPGFSADPAQPVLSSQVAGRAAAKQAAANAAAAQVSHANDVVRRVSAKTAVLQARLNATEAALELERQTSQGRVRATNDRVRAAEGATASAEERLAVMARQLAAVEAAAAKAAGALEREREAARVRARIRTEEDAAAGAVAGTDGALSAAAPAITVLALLATSAVAFWRTSAGAEQRQRQVRRRACFARVVYACQQNPACV